MAGNTPFRIGDRIFDVANNASRSAPPLKRGAVTDSTGPLDVTGVVMADGVAALDAVTLIADGFAVPVAQILGGRIVHPDRVGRPRVMAVFEAGEGGIKIIVAPHGTLATRLKIPQREIESNIAPRPAFLPMAALTGSNVSASRVTMINRIAPTKKRRQR